MANPHVDFPGEEEMIPIYIIFINLIKSKNQKLWEASNLNLTKTTHLNFTAWIWKQSSMLTFKFGVTEWRNLFAWIWIQSSMQTFKFRDAFSSYMNYRKICLRFTEGNVSGFKPRLLRITSWTIESTRNA